MSLKVEIILNKLEEREKPNLIIVLLNMLEYLDLLKSYLLMEWIDFIKLDLRFSIMMNYISYIAM